MVMKLNFSKAVTGTSLALLLCSLGTGARADAIPYPNAGTPNTAVYTFTAMATGDIIAYFAGSTADYDNQLGMLDNGSLTSAGFGLDNHTSTLGQAFNLGHVTAGDTLVFVLHNLTLGQNAYSDPSLNGSYDVNGSDGHQHVYSTAYTATSLIPAGTYVSFEDLPFPNSDFNYNDEDFVITNVAASVPAVGVPGPIAGAGLPGLLFALGGGVVWWRRRGKIA
jgi:hypothetical protein